MTKPENRNRTAYHDSIPTRGSLLGRIKDPENNAAWTEFCATYKKLVLRLALKAGLSEEEAEDVVQEVFISMTRNIGTFEYDPGFCSFKRWLSQMVRWRIQDEFRKRLPTDSAAGAERNQDGISDSQDYDNPTEPELEAVWEAEWKQHLIDTAAARVRKQVGPKQFQIFFLHVLKEMPVADVARRLKVTRAQVYLAKLRVGKLFRRELGAAGK